MTDFDTYMDKVIPVATAIAFIKAGLFKEFYEKLIVGIEKDQKRLDESEKEAVFKTIRQFISELPPEIFRISLDWQPTKEEVRRKLEDLKMDPRLREKLKRHLFHRLAPKQRKLGKFGIGKL
jgi:hypothetical protein